MHINDLFTSAPFGFPPVSKYPRLAQSLRSTEELYHSDEAASDVDSDTSNVLESFTANYGQDSKHESIKPPKGLDKSSYNTPYDFLQAADREFISKDFEHRASKYRCLGEYVYKRESENIQEDAAGSVGIAWSNMSSHVDRPGSGTSLYKYLYGDISSASLFILEKQPVFLGLVRPMYKDS